MLSARGPANLLSPFGQPDNALSTFLPLRNYLYSVQVDIDWNSDKRDWSAAQPMDAEENMLRNAQQIQKVNPDVITWVYRNGIKVSSSSADETEEIMMLQHHYQLTHHTPLPRTNRLHRFTTGRL